MGKLTQTEWERAVAENARKAPPIVSPIVNPAATALADYSIEQRGICTIYWVPTFRIRRGERHRSFR